MPSESYKSEGQGKGWSKVFKKTRPSNRYVVCACGHWEWADRKAAFCPGCGLAKPGARGGSGATAPIAPAGTAAHAAASAGAAESGSADGPAASPLASALLPISAALRALSASGELGQGTAQQVAEVSTLLDSVLVPQQPEKPEQYAELRKKYDEAGKRLRRAAGEKEDLDSQASKIEVQLAEIRKKQVANKTELEEANAACDTAYQKYQARARYSEEQTAKLQEASKEEEKTAAQNAGTAAGSTEAAGTQPPKLPTNDADMAEPGSTAATTELFDGAEEEEEAKLALENAKHKLTAEEQGLLERRAKKARVQQPATGNEAAEGRAATVLDSFAKAVAQLGKDLQSIHGKGKERTSPY